MPPFGYKPRPSWTPAGQTALHERELTESVEQALANADAMLRTRAEIRALPETAERD